MPSSRIEIIDRLTRSSQEATSRIRVHSALNPALWLCSVISVSSFALAAFGEASMRMPFLWVGCVPVGLVVFAYLYFMMRDPDRLQSEDYLIQKRALALIQEKGQTIPVSPASVEMIANPYTQRLPSGQEGE
jgi:hypothetical protein